MVYYNFTSLKIWIRWLKFLSLNPLDLVSCFSGPRLKLRITFVLFPVLCIRPGVSSLTGATLRTQLLHILLWLLSCLCCIVVSGEGIESVMFLSSCGAPFLLFNTIYLFFWCYINQRNGSRGVGGRCCDAFYRLQAV